MCIKNKNKTGVTLSSLKAGVAHDGSQIGVTHTNSQVGVTHAKSQVGVTLVELIVFIVIISVALVGVLKTLEVANRGSVDPMLSKQALAIAESLLTEIEQQPFTFCDPDDLNATTATSAASCANSQDKGGAALTTPTPATESRYSATNPFDNVADYGGFYMPDASCAGICNPGSTTPIPNLTGYSASVTITRVGNAAPFTAIPTADAALKITVQVTGPANTTVSLSGYRVRYAPTL
ncbi:MAG TPA: prepilin-type N-terminal cleavage/methylation domain-containing protein [Methylophilaceae bacterium]|jgi:MSHA pilin protein MshD